MLSRLGCQARPLRRSAELPPPRSSHSPSELPAGIDSPARQYNGAMASSHPSPPRRLPRWISLLLAALFVAALLWRQACY